MASVLAFSALAVLAMPSSAFAQAGSPFPPPGASPFPPAPSAGAPRGASPFPAPGAQPPRGRHPCEAFVPLREAAEKGAAAIKAASDRKATREEVCPLFKSFAAAESKMIKFLTDNQAMCGVPPDAIKQAKAGHGRTVQIRNQVCSAGPGPSGPSLSDALGAPLVPNEPPKPGRGTFDTLTGNVLGR
jgi:hypothetical protein